MRKLVQRGRFLDRHPAQLFAQVQEHGEIGPRCDAAYRQAKADVKTPLLCFKDVSAAEEPSPLIGDLQNSLETWAASGGQPALAKGSIHI